MMQSTARPAQASLRLSLWDAFFFSLMVGVGETYLPAYALSAGMSEWLTGLFAAVPLMSGAVIQLISPWLLMRVGSVQKWVVGSAFVQALAFVPLVYFCWRPTENLFWIFFFASIYWGAGFASGPSWNFWMGRIVPEAKVSHFFSQRHRIMQIGILLGLAGGGMMLHHEVKFEPFTSVFAILFVCAFLCRSLSAGFLALKQEKPPMVTKPQWQDLFSFWKVPAYRGFFGFLFCFYVAIYISSPFVTPFFLEKLQLSYEQYMFALAALLLAKIAILPFGASMMRRFGVKGVFFLGAIGMSPLPALWALNNQLWFVLGLQAVSGMFWGLFEVTLSVTFFNHIKPNQKILVLTAYNFFNSLAIVTGSLIGGQILKYFNASFLSYDLIFVLGSTLRCSICIFYAYKIRGKKHLVNHVEELEAPPGSFSGPLSRQAKTV